MILNQLKYILILIKVVFFGFTIFLCTSPISICPSMLLALCRLSPSFQRYPGKYKGHIQSSQHQVGRSESIKKLHALKADLWEASSYNEDSCTYFQALVFRFLHKRKCVRDTLSENTPLEHFWETGKKKLISKGNEHKI